MQKGTTVRHRPIWAPDEIVIERPAAARMDDYYLGGSHDFAADRAPAEQIMQLWPDLPHDARANRALPHRVVTFRTSAGTPTAAAVHRVSHAPGPAATVPVFSLATSRYHPEQARPAEQTSSCASYGMTFRDRAGILGLMPGYELVPPGPVDPIHARPAAQDRRPDPLDVAVERTAMSAATGRRQ
ncbi:MAG TPA: SAM-dependent methyltransferase [Actinocrinis sp.]|nr:SAM-dependent methyltransferase [Actinocrinis sp.]